MLDLIIGGVLTCVSIGAFVDLNKSAREFASSCGAKNANSKSEKMK